MEKTGKIPGAIRHNWDHQQPCILSKAVPPELLEIVYLSRRSLWREATSTLSCTEQQASHEYYQLSLPVGECGLPLTASGSPKIRLLSSSLSRRSLDVSPSLCSSTGCSPCYHGKGGTCWHRGLSPHGEWRGGRSERFLTLWRRAFMENHPLLFSLTCFSRGNAAGCASIP